MFCRHDRDPPFGGTAITALAASGAKQRDGGNGQDEIQTIVTDRVTINLTLAAPTVFGGIVDKLPVTNGLLLGTVNGDGVSDFAFNMTGIIALSAADLIL